MAAAKSRTPRRKTTATKAAPKKKATARKTTARPKATAAKKATPKKAAARKPAAPKAAAKKRQQSAALKKANAVRSKRAKVRKAIESGKQDAADVLRALPDELGGVPVQEFLLWVPGIGKENVKKLTRGVILSPTVELGSLGQHTIERLVTRIGRRTPGERAASLRAA